MRRPTLRQLAWFLALWAGGVGALMAAGGLLKLIL